MADGNVGLTIIDVSDPKNPELVRNINTGGYAKAVSSIEKEGIIYALVADGNAGLKIIDFSDLKNPVLDGNISTGEKATEVSAI